MNTNRLILPLTIALSSIAGTQAIAEVTCAEGYQAYAVSGHAKSQSIDATTQEGFANISLSAAQGGHSTRYAGTFVGKIVGVNDFGLPKLNHDFKLYHSREGHVWLGSRGDSAISVTPTDGCGPDLFEADVTEQLSYFPIGSGSLAGVHGEVTATGTLNIRCTGRNAFRLSGTLCLAETQ